jgi:hypothetical protein
MKEFERSVGTAEPKLARTRAASATIWFQGMMDRLRKMATPTRADLESAAQRYFFRLRHELDQPRDFDPENLENDVAFQVEATTSRIAEIESQLVHNVFDRQIVSGRAHAY